jgi:hypothetical protein
MRIFLTLFLASITYRCFAIFLPISDWASDYSVRRYPTRLSTLAELEEAAGKTSNEKPHPVADDLLLTADSVWDYWKPWPDADTRAQIKTWSDGAKVTACWFHYRLGFVEHVCAINEGWPMFSPTVATSEILTRARLFYADDRDVVLRQVSEPEDYAHYCRWFYDKRGNYERSADDNDPDSCEGYCNFLLHRYGQNAEGAKLVKIVLFRVRVILPPPNVDPKAHYEEQNRRTASPPRRDGHYRSDRAGPAALVVGAGAGVTGGRVVRANAALWTPQVLPDYYEYDVAERKGRSLVVEP